MNNNLRKVILFFFVVIVRCEMIQQEWKNQFNFELSGTPPEIQEDTVRGMLIRLLPDHHHLFQVKVDPNLGPPQKDTFRIISPSSVNLLTVSVVGTTGVSISAGILHYLKYYCNSHISWEANNINIPTSLPPAQVKVSTGDRFRYYQNVCTSSYSFVWWDWAEWEKHIDWMAMNGINFPLAFTGQEAIWRKVYLSLNFTTDDLDKHFAGPSFLAWSRMGNIKAWGGPLSVNWHQRTLDLQKKILKRMRNFGMLPILPAFAGHVPDSIKRIYPEANVTTLPTWANFTDISLTSTLLLDPRDPLFSVIGKMFINEMVKEYNSTDHFYNCDTFIEMDPPSDDPDYLKEVGASIFKAMTDVDPKATWVMQGWLFQYKFWTKRASKALLTSVPKGKMIVLDLYSETSPQYMRLQSYYGQPFIFCMLHNFGGVDGMYGNVEMLLENLKNVRTFPNVTLAGIGISPEGINQNYVMYDLMLELAWRKPQLNYTQWITKYSQRRYGDFSQNLLVKAWKILIKSVYNCHHPHEFHGENNLIARRPNIELKPVLWYKVSDLLNVWDHFIAATREGSSNDSSRQNISQIDSYSEENSLGGNFTNKFPETFNHDLIDVTRQVLQVYGGILASNIRKSFKNNSFEDLINYGTEMMILLTNLDQLLLSSKSFLLGKWLKDAESCSTSREEGDQYRRNSLHQLTLWGPNGEILDYAIKQWNGLVGKYMQPRWKLFISQLKFCLQNGTNFVQKSYDSDVFYQIEKPFALDVKQSYPADSEGDAVKSAVNIYEIYRKRFGIPTAINTLEPEQISLDFDNN